MSKIVGVTVGTPLSLSRIKNEIEPVIENHEKNKENPHGVTKEQIGLGKVDNTSDIDKPVSTAQAKAIADAKKAGTDAQTAANNAQNTFNQHSANKNNPHGVTIGQIGAQAQHWNKEITLLANQWTGNSQTVAVEGLSKDDTVFATPASESYDQYVAFGVKLSSQDAGTLTFVCEDAPDGDMTVGVSVFADGDYDADDIPTSSGNVSYTPQQCMDAFFAYSAKKRKNYDINDTNYADPSGYAEGSYTTPADLFRIGLIVASNSKSIKWWGGREKYATVNFMGEHEREVTIADLWNGVGGTRFCNKSGGVSHSDGKHRAGFQMTIINNKHAAISIMIKGSAHYDYITTYISNIKQMLRDLDEGKTVTEPEGLAAMVAAGGGYVASFLPGDISMYQQVTYDQMISTDGKSGVLKDFMIRNNPKAKNGPASTTKIMTLLCVLDAMRSELETIEIIEDDITAGSGLEVFPGDRLTVGDALFCMMRNSSNTVATTLARNVGKWVLEGRDNVSGNVGNSCDCTTQKLELVATLEDGSTVTYNLHGEAVAE